MQQVMHIINIRLDRVNFNITVFCNVTTHTTIYTTKSNQEKAVTSFLLNVGS